MCIRDSLKSTRSSKRKKLIGRGFTRRTRIGIIYAGRCVEPNAESVRFKLHQYGQLKPLVKCVVDTYDSLPRSLIERIRKMSQARAEASIASTAEIRAQFPALERVHNGYS